MKLREETRLAKPKSEAIYTDSNDRVTLPSETTLSTVYMQKVP